MKKVFPVILICVIIGAIFASRLLLKDDTDSKKGDDWFFDYVGRAYSADGGLYSENGYLYYIDADTEKNVMICNDASCSHSKETCSAYFDSLRLMGIVENEKLLLITDYGANKLGELFLYESSVNGKNRKQLAKLSDNIQNITKTIITEKYIVIAYNNQYDSNCKELDLPIAGIYLYDRNTGEGKSIYEIEMWNALIFSMDLYENKSIYYSLFGYDIDRQEALKHVEDIDYLKKYKSSAIYRIDLTGDNNQKLQDSDDPTVLMPYNNTYFFNDKEVLYALDIKTNTKKKLGPQMTLIPTYQENAMYFAEYNHEKKKSILYRYDGRMKEMGYIKDNYGVNAIFGDVVYIQDYKTEDDNLKCLKTVEAVLE